MQLTSIDVILASLILERMPLNTAIGIESGWLSVLLIGKEKAFNEGIFATLSFMIQKKDCGKAIDYLLSNGIVELVNETACTYRLTEQGQKMKGPLITYTI